MLNLKDKRNSTKAKGRSYTELLPFMIMTKPDMILNKDGGFLVCYTFEGVDVENLQTIDSDRYANIMEHAFRVFDERITLWWTVDRRRTTDYPQGEFPDEISKMIDDIRKEEFESGNQYANKHYLAILYRPEGANSGFLDRLGYFTTDMGQNMLQAFWNTLKASYFNRSTFAYQQAKIDSEIRSFEEMLSGFDETVKDIGLYRIENAELLQYLHDRVNPASCNQPVKIPDFPCYLDSYLPDNTLTVGHSHLVFEHVDRTHVAGISVKDWPDLTVPGFIDELLAVPGEITISQCFRYVEMENAKKYIDGIRKHNLNSQKSMWTYVSEALTNKESDKRDDGKVLAAQDASEALASIMVQNRVFGYYNLSILSYGETLQECERTLKFTSQILRQRGFLIVRERMHLLSAWAGSIPGQWAELVRWFFLNTGNLADMSPIRTLATGSTSNPFLSQQTGRDCAALTALSTEYSTPFYFNYHNGDLAHTLVIGPSGAGKSVFNNFLMSQFRKYSPCRIIVFDKDYSCNIPTLLQDGKHVDLTGEGNKVRLNPIGFALGDRNAWVWLAQWLELLISSRGYQMNANDDQSILNAFENLVSYPPERWRLRSLAPLLPIHLSEQLQQWIGDGILSKFFDNEEDDFSLSSSTTVEMNGLFANERVANAFMDYAFYRIQKMLDGTPTLIYVEEAWFMLKEPKFEMKIMDWLKTLRKKNAFLIMATQSLDELANADIFASIIDNIPNKIFLANFSADAHWDLYVKKFGLNPEQVMRIKNAQPKRNYYIVTQRMSRMVEVSFKPEILACLRSDAKAQSIFRKHHSNREDDVNWKQNYIKELVNA